MRRFRLTWGILLLVFGSLLLMDNLGVFDFLGVSVWGLFWPLMLIGLGAWVLWLSRGAVNYGEEEDIAIPAEDTEHYSVNIKYGAGELNMQGKFGTENLLDCHAYGGCRYEVTSSGDTKRIKLWTPPYIQPFRFVNRRKWDVVLDGSLPCDLTLHTGACDTKIDLSDTLVQSLYIDSGASSTRVTLPENAEMTRVKCTGGAASLTLIIPDEVAAHIEVKGGIYSANVNQDRFPRQAGAYESPGYATAENKVDIIVDMGLGSIQIR
jgi:hypothetical protein